MPLAHLLFMVFVSQTTSFPPESSSVDEAEAGPPHVGEPRVWSEKSGGMHRSLPRVNSGHQDSQNMVAEILELIQNRLDREDYVYQPCSRSVEEVRSCEWRSGW